MRPMRARPILACGLSLLLVAAASAQDLRLIRPVFQTAPEPNGNPKGFVGLGQWVFCRADQGLARFDRSGANARWLGVPWGGRWTASELAAAGGKLYFASMGGLQVTDGRQPPAAVDPQAGFTATSGLTPLGPRLLFSAISSAGRELWITDGTPAGTQQLADIRAGSADSTPRDLMLVGNGVAFVADDGRVGEELWRTDGTPTGTVLLKDVRPGSASASIRYPTSDGATLWFFADAGRGDELWRSDGTANGTLPVALATADPTLTPLGASALFLQTRNNRQQLWISDGTPTGSRFVKDLAPGSARTTGIRPVVAGSYLYFAAADANGDGELWRSDGTAMGTIRLSPAAGHVPSGATLASLGLGVYFPGGLGSANGTELWTTDGTAQGTRQLVDIRLGASASSSPAALTAVGGALWFAADDGTSGVEPWRTDGTAAGTGLVANIGSGGTDGRVDLGKILEADHTAWFLQETGATSVPLWRTDGTPTGTTSVQVPGYYNFAWRSVFAGARRIFFAAPATPSATDLTDLWTTDGTQAGTRLFRSGIGWVMDMVDLGNVALFGGGSASFELWRTDGTPSGTFRLNNTISTLRVSGERFARVGNRAWFADQMLRLTVSDGTAAGTTGVAAVAGLPVYSEPVAVGNRIAFLSQPPAVVLTDGTAAGTVSAPLNSTIYFRSPLLVAAKRGVFVIMMEHFSYPQRSELWFSDGTTAGTRLLATTAVAMFGRPRVWQDRLYFAWHSAAAGVEPWVSDGTVQGTTMLRDIEPGTASSLTNVGTSFGTAVGTRFLYFLAMSDFRTALWRTDGRPADTVEVDPNHPSASPFFAPAHVKGKLVFLAEDPVLGHQPHALDLWASTKAIGNGCARGNAEPTLAATDPILGGTLQVDLSSSHATQGALLVFGLPHASALQQVRFPGGCVVLFDAAMPTFAVPLRTDATGAARLTASLPLLPALIGARVVVQAAAGATATPPFRTDLSAGVELKLGR